jgi:hypothetical protein
MREGPEHKKRVYNAVRRALLNTTLSSEDYRAIQMWVNKELPQLESPGVTSYVVFGSYRGQYQISLRTAQYELAKESQAKAIVLGDTPEIGLTIGHGRTDPLEFEIKFFLLTEFADKNVGVYEKDSGGEGPELGLLRQAYCFNKTAILPRDYYGLGYEDVGARNGEEKVDRIKEIARHIAFADDLDDEQTMLELRGLIATAQNDGIDITEHELTEFLDDEIANRNTNDPEYSWVHLALFRRFEEAGQCHSWFDEQELRDTVNYVSLGSTVQWDYIIDTDELR